MFRHQDLKTYPNEMLIEYARHSLNKNAQICLKEGQ